jgi:hypothetical protein
MAATVDASIERERESGEGASTIITKMRMSSDSCSTSPTERHTPSSSEENIVVARGRGPTVLCFALDLWRRQRSGDGGGWGSRPAARLTPVSLRVGRCGVGFVPCDMV